VSVVRVERLTKSYGGRPPALADVTLEIGPGVTGLLGPNGAGKSTLLQCVLGLLRDFSGTATVLGLDASRDRMAIRRRVGYMPETDSQIPRMSGVASTRYLAEITGLPRNEALRRAHECLHYVGLTEALYRDADEYSTGMLQRLKLAQALAHDPELLFLDEPVSGMDPAGREEFLRLIRSLARDHGKHVVWSSHMLPDVQRVADAVLVLDRGQLKGSFRIEDLKAATGRYEVEGEGEGTGFEEAVRERGGSLAAPLVLEDAPDAQGRPKFRCVVAHPAPDATVRIVGAAAAVSTRLRRATPVVERLEDVFHRLLGRGGAPPGAPPPPASGKAAPR
jgi:ABC-2 type transport system ATP-binding protein